ncbi:unnamed protein product [Pieris macdunnoughi]|uniref:Uncharacterized protein n=1 Tax=Pieris macdunnoughi TaxID=345717 RepID=A0A821YH59_9NEOP|nr:unnamed protein product [Pieris macdunnoughi]
MLFVVFVTCSKTSRIQQKIKELEKEENYLLKELNVIINKNVDFLEKVNDSEAVLGVHYLRDLQKQIKDLNSSDIRDIEITHSEQFNDTSNTFRRKAKKKPHHDFMLDLEKILKPKHVSEKKLKQMIDNRDVIKKKLDDWILEREKEKERIRKYRMQTKYLLRAGKVEKCPRFGFSGKKKKRDDDDYTSCKKKYKDRYDKHCDPNRKKVPKPPKTPSSGKKMYPCCRKCCKKSYMGCL